MNVTTLPAVQGQRGYFDSRYRLWTINEVPYGRFPRYDDGGPAMVVIGGWNKSTERLCRVLSSPSVVETDDGKITLYLWRTTGGGGISGYDLQVIRHELDGTKYDTDDEVDRAAYESGTTAYMVYVKREREYGIVDPNLEY